MRCVDLLAHLRPALLTACVAVAALAGGGALRAADKQDPFALENKADEAKPARAPKARPDAKAPPTAERIDFDVSVSPKEARRGTTVKLTITGTPRKGFHTYPITQRSADVRDGLDVQGPSMLSKLKYQDTPGLKPLWPVAESPPEWENVPNVGYLLEHKKKFTWSQDIVVLPDAEPGVKTLRLGIWVEVCNENCATGTHPFDVPIKVTDEPAAALSPELQARLDAPPPGPEALQPPGTPVGPMDTSLLGVLLASMGAAIGMLFTPCVFPMIPITVSFFLKQSERKHHNALLTAGVYSGTIIVVLALAVLLLGKLIIDWANSPWLNLGLGALLVFFALSLFGMYEIELPSFLARFTSAREGQGGYVGAFFMALTFTITSFTCTGPFLGPLLVAAKEMHLGLFQLILAAFAYSATFAAPFFVLALFPRLLKALPKSGGWLNSVKVVMGFLELAAALKFLANTDLAWHPGSPWLFNYDTVLCAWIALAVACGLYLFGAFRLPHDSPVEHLGVPRMVLGTIFLGLAVYMVPALWRETPIGVIGNGLVAFLPLDTKPAKEELPWHRDYESAWAEAKKDKKLIFIDFTGVNCTNCRANEKAVFPLPAVREELKKYVLVQLYTDSVPNPELSPEESINQAVRNSGWQSETFGDVTNPLYVVLQPDEDAPVEEGRLKGLALGRYAGFIRDPQAFVQFLKKPQKQAAAQAEGG